MPKFANTTPNPVKDGVVYALNKVLTSLESDLYNGGRNDLPPVPTLYDRAVLASVTFNAGAGATGPAYVVLQTSVDGGQTWLDLAWCTWPGTQGATTFFLSAGSDGANVFQQVRPAGTAPGSSGNQAATGANQCCLGGQLRFVGKAGVTPSSSPGPGQSSSASPGITVNIYYRALGLR